MNVAVATTLRTARLLLRPWDPADAAALLPILEANASRLERWVPAHVFMPVPEPELAIRLAQFADDFAAHRAYRYALLTPDGTQILGEADLFPRAATGRVPLSAADHVELGYWLVSSATGKGLATEAAGTLLEMAAKLPGLTHAEIRCDIGNSASAAVPQRLGFELARVDNGDQIWRTALSAG